MAYPGDRRRKTRIAISPLTGAVNFDLPIFLTEADFVDASKTLGGENAMADGGADVAFSLDAEGTIWLDREIVRCDLSATPADSRIEIVVTVPASHLSDTVDSYIYCWFGSETETQPAPDGLYGKYAVWNGPTRDGFTPITAWGAWHFDEDPSDPSPPFKDSSGNDRHMTAEAAGSPTLVEGEPGRGLQTTGVADDLVVVGLTGTDAPGTGPWCVVSACPVCSTDGGSLMAQESYSMGRRMSRYSDSVNFRFGAAEASVYGLSSTGPVMAAISRSGDVAVVTANQYNDSVSGLSSVNYNWTEDLRLRADYNDTSARVIVHSFACVLACAPNVYWLRALYDNVYGTGFFGTPKASEPAAIAAEIYFDGLNAGTEVRVYEQPHGQSWRVDLDGVTPADLNETVIQFQIQGESTAADHYVWFNYDDTGTDPEPGGTGHAVAIATTDTAADVADTLQGVLNAITDLSATVDGTVVEVLNDRNGELTEPTTDSTAELTLVQIGGTATSAIDGIESSTGTSWTASYTILRPRRARIAMLSIAYENVQLFVVLTTSGVVVPASALQREDPNYANPA
jgi:hypothetical protein